MEYKDLSSHKHCMDSWFGFAKCLRTVLQIVVIEGVRTGREDGFRPPKVIYQPSAARTLGSCCQQDKNEVIGLTAMREGG